MKEEKLSMAKLGRKNADITEVANVKHQTANDSTSLPSVPYILLRVLTLAWVALTLQGEEPLIITSHYKSQHHIVNCIITHPRHSRLQKFPAVILQGFGATYRYKT